MTEFRSSRRSALGLLGAVPLAATGVLGTAGTAQGNAGNHRVPADLRPGGKLDRLIADLAAEDEYSGTVLLLHHGRPVLSRTHGMANKERSIPNRPDTIFALGSITKLFTAVAVAQLVQQGKLAYHDTLGTYLDGFPANIAGTVTIHQLVTHTSGMGDIFRDPATLEHAVTWSSAQEVMDSALNLIRKAPLDFTPGAGYTYSNNGYHVLGAIVAAVSGQSYHDYIRQHVFRTAGMTAADFYTRTQWRDNPRIARPYATSPSGQREDALNQHLYIGTPAGGAHASAPDLVRFAKALMNDTLLDATHTWLTVTPKLPLPPLPPRPGKPMQIKFGTYGPGADILNNQWILGHNGGTSNGIATSLDWYPDAGWTTVDLCNYNMGTTMPIDTQVRVLITQT